MGDYYKALNIHPTATSAEIQSAYNKERARLLSTNEEDEEQLAVLDEAYAILSDAGQRRAYDRTLQDAAGQHSLVLAEKPVNIVTASVPTVPIVQQLCPHCGEANPVQATSCHKCGKQVSRPCPQCGQRVVLTQTICSRCNTYIPEYDKRRFGEALAIEHKVEKERISSQSRIDLLEQIHTVNRRLGVVFWLVVIGLCIGLAIVAALFSGIVDRFF